MNLEEYWRHIDDGSSEARQSRALMRIPFLRVYLLLEAERGHPYRLYREDKWSDYPGVGPPKRPR
jgi:hypothetical protein